MQLYKYNARTLLSRTLGIVNSDWLQHVRGVCRVYDSCLTCVHVYLHQAQHTLYPLKIILLDACPCIFTPCTTHHAPIMLLLHMKSHTHFFFNPHTTKKARIFSIDKSIVHEQSTAPCCGLAGVQWPAAKCEIQAVVVIPSLKFQFRCNALDDCVLTGVYVIYSQLLFTNYFTTSNIINMPTIFTYFLLYHCHPSVSDTYQNAPHYVS